jgi:hypothetical protein
MPAPISPLAVIDKRVALQQFQHRRGRNGQETMRRAHLPAPARQRADRPDTGRKRGDNGGGDKDIDNRIQRADLMEGDLVRVLAMHYGLGPGQQFEDAQRRLAHRAVQRGSFQPAANIAPMGMGFPGLVLAVAPRGNVLHNEPRPRQHAVAMGLAGDAQRIGQPHRRNRRRAARPETGPNIQQRRGEHIPRHAAHGIQMDRRHCYIFDIVGHPPVPVVAAPEGRIAIRPRFTAKTRE